MNLRSVTSSWLTGFGKRPIIGAVHCRAPRAVLIATLLLVFLDAFGAAGRRDGDVVAQQNEPSDIPKPFLLVEGWFDRNYVSDLYAFDLNGTLIRRLTSEPLPTNALAAVAPGRGDPFFIANASAFYGLSLRHNILMAIHAANVRVPTLSPDGDTIAFVIVPEDTAGARAADSPPAPIVRVMPVSARSTWRPAQVPLAAGIVASEMTFAPDGKHVLITHWTGDLTAQLLLIDLTNGVSRTVLAGDDVAYYEPVFAPDGKSLLAVREDLTAGRWSIVSLAWPAATAPGVVLTSPRGVQLSTPTFLADGGRFLFYQGSALARATVDGKTVDAIFGDLDGKERNWPPQSTVHRAHPGRASWMPRVVNRYLARVEWRQLENPAAPAVPEVILIDVQTKQRTTIPMPTGRVFAAVVVE